MATVTSPVSRTRGISPWYLLHRSLVSFSRRSGNVSYASPAFREASQAARQARFANDRLSQDAPSSTRRRARPPSDDSDSDSRPLSQRRRRRAPRPMSNSGPSSIPSPPPVAAASSPPPIVTPPPIPSQADVSPDPTSTEADPSLRSPPATSPPEPSPVPPSVPAGSAAGPSVPLGSAVGPSESPPLTHYCYCTTVPSEERLWSRADVPTNSLRIKGRLATLWEESIQHMNSLPPPAQMDKFSELYIKNKMLRDKVADLELQLNDPAQASHALRAEIKDLTKQKNSLEVSLARANHELKGLKEEQS
ncbi:putative protein TPRXL [Zingiber officinale]|uniref:putative protein TPRXL n=1 Tax=Zingiber officinale TaxID=94328 RepID=UPI001C4B1F04|nr:putative protein TPRXL [Zingiber officinale]